MVQPTTLVCSRRPGRRSSQGARPLNMSCLRACCGTGSRPIHRNSGSAVSVQLDVDPQMVSIMLSPTGRVGEQLHADQAPPRAARARSTDHDPQQGEQQLAIRPAAIRTSMASSFVGGRFIRCGRRRTLTAMKWHTLPAHHQRLGKGQRKTGAAQGHADLRYPQRRGVRPRRDVVRGPGHPDQTGSAYQAMASATTPARLARQIHSKRAAHTGPADGPACRVTRMCSPWRRVAGQCQEQGGRRWRSRRRRRGRRMSQVDDLARHHARAVTAPKAATMDTHGQEQQQPGRKRETSLSMAYSCNAPEKEFGSKKRDCGGSARCAARPACAAFRHASDATTSCGRRRSRPGLRDRRS